MMRGNGIVIAGSVAGLCLATFSSPAMAQNVSATAQPDAEAPNQIQDIIVTAQRQEQNIQKVPIAVTAIGGAQLEQRGITSVLDLSGAVPGLQFQSYGGVQLPFLRGIGATGSTLGNESSVASYIDDVYFARVPSSFGDLRNVERVEVLKGPQGTLFGRNATGGVINIITRDPSHDTHVDGSVGYGRFQAVQGNLYATTGLSDKVAVDLSLTGKRSDGFGKNLTTGSGYGYDDGYLIRSKLLFEPSDATKFVLSGFNSYSQDSGQKGAFPGTAVGTLSPPNQVFRSEDIGFYNSIANLNNDKYKFWGVSLRAEQELSFARLISISAYSRLNEVHHFDADYEPREDRTVNIHSRLDLFTQELRLISLPGSSLSWVAGLYYYNNKSSYRDVKLLAPLLYGPGGLFAPSYQRTISYAGFAQVTYEIAPRLKLTGGLRYTQDRVSAFGRVILQTIPPVSLLNLPKDSTKLNRLTFRAGADYQVAPDALVYASFSRGAKANTYNILTFSGKPNAPERLDAYEIGFKSTLFDRRLRFNGALFYYDVKNPQVQLLNLGTVQFSNAGGSRVKGAEFEAQAILGGGLTGRASFSYLDSKYTNYGSRNAAGNIVNGAPSTIPDLVNGGAIAGPAIDARGQYTPLAAKTTFNLGLDYAVTTSIGKFLATVDLYHNSGYFFEPDNFLHQKAYDLLDAQIRYSPNQKYSVRFWGRNLLDRKHIIAAASQASFVHEGGYPYTPAPPRTYGVAFDFSF